MFTFRKCLRWSSRKAVPVPTSVIGGLGAPERLAILFRDELYSHGIWAGALGGVRMRSRIVAKPYQFLYERPFPDDWKSPDTSRKADAVNTFSKSWSQSSRPQFCLSVEPLSLSHSLFLCLTKKPCLLNRTGSRRTCSKLSLCVIGNSSVFLRCCHYWLTLSQATVHTSRKLKLTRTSITFSFTENHNQPLQLRRARNFFPRKGVVSKAKSKARMRYHGYWGTWRGTRRYPNIALSGTVHCKLSFRLLMMPGAQIKQWTALFAAEEPVRGKGLTSWRARHWRNASLEVNYAYTPFNSRKITSFRNLQITIIPGSNLVNQKSGYKQSMDERL